jgi:hypothetical protein
MKTIKIIESVFFGHPTTFFSILFTFTMINYFTLSNLILILPKGLTFLR